jgi:hypothetical protein
MEQADLFEHPGTAERSHVESGHPPRLDKRCHGPLGLLVVAGYERLKFLSGDLTELYREVVDPRSHAGRDVPSKLTTNESAG